MEWGCHSYRMYIQYVYTQAVITKVWKSASKCLCKHSKIEAQEQYIFVPKSIIPFITDTPSQAHAVMGPPETRCVPFLKWLFLIVEGRNLRLHPELKALF